MANKRNILKWAAFSIASISSICLLVLFSLKNDVTPRSQKLTVSPAFDLPANQIGTFKLVRYSAGKDNRPLFSVSFDNLLVENNKFGIFKTALHQVIRISNFQFNCYQYSNKSRAGSDPIHNSDFRNNILVHPAFFIGQPLGKQEGWRINFDMNAGNVSELIINNFGYSVFFGEDLILAIQSKRAQASYSSSGLVLRGQVVIKAGRGNVLQANHIEWDIEDKIFAVHGVYSLNKNGLVKMGRNISLDHALNEITSKQTVNAYQKGEPKCLAKL